MVGSMEQMGRGEEEGLNTSVTPFDENTGLVGVPVHEREGGRMSIRTNVRRSRVVSRGVGGGVEEGEELGELELANGDDEDEDEGVEGFFLPPRL